MKSPRQAEQKLQPSVSRQMREPVGKECNETIAAYATTVQIEYGNAQPREQCAGPTPKEEGEALDKAKDAFKGTAAAYCATRACGPQQRCTASVTIASVEDLGVVSTPVTGDTRVRCAIRFKVVGSITCTCQAAGD